MQRLLAVPVGDSDVRATAGPVIERGPDAYKLASPTLSQIRSGEGVMQRGMGGADVRELQKMLNAQGANPPLALDGKFGPRTEAALKAFQQANGVQATGVLGRQTLGRFDANPRPIPADALSSSGSVDRVDARNLGGTALGNKVGDAAERAARQLNSVGRCALGVNNALESLGVMGRGHAYQKAEQLERNPRFREVNVAASDLSSLPRGAVVVWGRSASKPYGHVSVALGDGREASDHIQRQITGGRYGTDYGNGPDPHGRQVRVFLPA
jgi:peptidoglycan hydrolase-like protein with peptidoglycan-binding domain